MKERRSDFERLGDSLGVSSFRIYLAEALASRFSTNDGRLAELMRWLLLHVAVQAGSGHLRTDLTAVAAEMGEWYAAGSGPAPPGFNPGIPAMIADAMDELTEAALGCAFWGHLESEDAKADPFEVPRPPLVLTHDRRHLYFLRRRRLEDELLERLQRRVEADGGNGSRGGGFPLPAELPAGPGGRLAAHLAEGRRLLLLAGGPGTGKTTAVAALLRILEKGRAEAGLNRLKAALAAPTGRAAARMADGLAAAGKEGTDYSARTLHGLLGTRPGRPPLRNSERPLDADLVIVDEASMVDAAMMTALLAAMPDHAPLLLVGDPDQLPSVEAGALLGDLLSAEGGRLSGATERLTTVYRSSKAVLEAASAVRSGDAAALTAAYNGSDEEGDGVRVHEPGSPAAVGLLIAGIYRELVAAAASSPGNPAALFALMERHAVLTPMRRGPWGVAAMNDRVSLALGGTTSPFPGMPVVITRNDPARSLWNGDRGVVLPDRGRIRVRFPERGGFRSLPLAALPGWEPAWLQTIHKSQGSEFDRVTVLLPEGAGRLLSREILYTAFTRARNRVDLYTEPEIVEEALSRHVVRHSRIRLWAVGGPGNGASG